MVRYRTFQLRFQPLPDILVHAPLVATFSDTCTVVEDVTMGCHEGAVWLVPQRPECRAMYVRIEEGLEQFGVKLSGRPDMWKCANLRQVLQDYQVALGDGSRLNFFPGDAFEMQP